MGVVSNFKFDYYLSKHSPFELVCKKSVNLTWFPIKVTNRWNRSLSQSKYYVTFIPLQLRSDISTVEQTSNSFSVSAFYPAGVDDNSNFAGVVVVVVIHGQTKSWKSQRFIVSSGFSVPTGVPLNCTQHGALGGKSIAVFLGNYLFHRHARWWWWSCSLVG